MTEVIQDVYINAVLYIMEIQLNNDGTSTMQLTEGCNHPSFEGCNHKTYDFKEFIA
jgi:hypothetical protein